MEFDKNVKNVATLKKLIEDKLIIYWITIQILRKKKKTTTGLDYGHPLKSKP